MEIKMIKNWLGLLKIKTGTADNWDVYSVQILKCNGDVLTYEFDTLENAKSFAEVISKEKEVDYCEVL